MSAGKNLQENSPDTLPYFVAPLRFGTINQTLYRGSYPNLRNFRFLLRLKLKCILSLIPEPPTADLVTFASIYNIQLIHIPVNRTTALSSLTKSMSKALNAVINAENSPIYVHCLDGRRITGILVLLLRRLQGWVPQGVLREYWMYQLTNCFLLPSLGEVEKATRDIEKFSLEVLEIVIPEKIPQWLWNGDRSFGMGGFKLKYEAEKSKSSENLLDAAGVSYAKASSLEHFGTTSKALFMGVVDSAKLSGTLTHDSRNLSALDLHGFEESLVATTSEKTSTANC